MREVLAHYRIISRLGAGGMGEVFLAEDTRLDRKGALKVLPETISANPDGLNRFIQEAKAASALNHPNIITVHDIGEFEGNHYIATEFIDGQTLRERMKKRLTFEETMSILIQTAEALAAAHQAGIVHRDIKPENVMVRDDGYVKVLDFGLAKLAEYQSSNGTYEAEDATRKLVRTNPGVVMGTVSYMSPEQARGKTVDARSDLFSFGVMTYEILSGRVPFEGETAMDVIQVIINQEPTTLQSLAPHLPKELVRIVQKTLKKKREQRYHSTKDLLNDLKELRDELQQESILERTVMPDRANSDKEISSGQRVSTSSGGGIKDALLLTDFANTTGEAIFDYTLKTALAFSLAQSPFLEIVPDAKISQTLRLMKRDPNERVTREVAYEICARQNLKAFLAGTISNFGSIYVLTLEALNARSGESLGRELEQVNSREEILNGLGRAAAGIREKLGESLSSIEKFNLGVERTTSSLEALKLYALARGQTFEGKQLEGIPFLQKALEIDPNFVAAYLQLATIYANTNQWKLGAELISTAYELRDTVSEPEKLRIAFFYNSYVTGDIDKSIDALELWRSTYPLDFIPLVNLSDCFERIGKSEKAVEIARQGMKLNADNATIYINLAESSLSLNHLSEVKETCDQAFQKNIDSSYFHLFLYKTAFIENDGLMMAEHLKWFSGRNDEYLSVDLQGGAAAFQGKWRSAQDFSRRSVDLANRNGAKEVAARFAAEQALRIVFWSSGSGLPSADDSQLKTVLKTQINKAINLERSKEVLARAALAMAAAGQVAEAQAVSDELQRDGPKDTLINELWLPQIRAALLLHRAKAKEAIEELEVTERFERAAEFFPQYLRGLAYLKLNKTRAAVVEFDKILNNRGEGPLSSIYPLAQLGKARALKDKAEFEKFFELWKDADPDMPALVAARLEFEAL